MGYSRKIQTGERVENITFWKKTLRFLGLLLHRWKSRKKTSLHAWKFHKTVLPPLEILSCETKTHGNSKRIFLDHPWKFLFLLLDPRIFHIIFLQYLWKFHVLDSLLHPPCFDFFWNYPMALGLLQELWLHLYNCGVSACCKCSQMVIMQTLNPAIRPSTVSAESLLEILPLWLN